jgi:NAD(P)-dependent dehydrogenase (short-subunit alcohol dehydrogenase family)
MSKVWFITGAVRGMGATIVRAIATAALASEIRKEAYQ